GIIDGFLRGLVAARVERAANRGRGIVLAAWHGKAFSRAARRSFDNVQLMSLTGVAGMLEIGGGLLLLIGLFTRPVAFVLSGEMAFAYFIAHAPRGLLPLPNGGELAVVYCFLFLYLSVAGGGASSVDAYRQGAVTS